MKSNPAALSLVRQSPERVSPREAAVLELASLSRADIALVLGISENTVKAHLRSAYQKLAVESRAAAALAWRDRRAA